MKSIQQAVYAPSGHSGPTLSFHRHQRTEDRMNSLSHPQLIGGWLAAMIVLIACTVVVAGATVTPGAASLWFAACIVPPALLLLLSHSVSQRPIPITEAK